MARLALILIVFGCAGEFPHNLSPPAPHLRAPTSTPLPSPLLIPAPPLPHTRRTHVTLNRPVPGYPEASPSATPVRKWGEKSVFLLLRETRAHCGPCLPRPARPAAQAQEESLCRGGISGRAVAHPRRRPPAVCHPTEQSKNSSDLRDTMCPTHALNGRSPPSLWGLLCAFLVPPPPSSQVTDPPERCVHHSLAFLQIFTYVGISNILSLSALALYVME